MAHILLMDSVIIYKELCTLLIISNLYLEKWNYFLRVLLILGKMMRGHKWVSLFTKGQTAVLVIENPIVAQG